MRLFKILYQEEGVELFVQAGEQVESRFVGRDEAQEGELVEQATSHVKGFGTFGQQREEPGQAGVVFVDPLAWKPEIVLVTKDK